VSPHPKLSYEFAGFLLDPAEQVLLRQNGETVPLTPKAFLTLLVLLQNCGRTVEKEELLREVWPGTFVEEGNLTVTIFMLRKSLGEGRNEHKYIKTVPRRGYRFVAPVREVQTPAPPRALDERRTAQPAGAEERASVAILPLLNVSGDASAEYLSDGITESIINSLSQLPSLRVLARSTVFRYKGLDVDPQSVGREMRVRAVLTGRLIQLDDNLIIRTELVDTESGWQLWGEQYNRKTSDILSVQEEISRHISEKLRTKLSGEEQERLAKRPTQSNIAYQTYLKGRFHWNKRTQEGIERGIEYFKEAIALDPAYALAYAGLADSYALLGAVEYAALSPGEAMQQRAKPRSKPSPLTTRSPKRTPRSPTCGFSIGTGRRPSANIVAPSNSTRPTPPRTTGTRITSPRWGDRPKPSPK
jgi:TolB-like protein